jgi:hypothetical protein
VAREGVLREQVERIEGRLVISKSTAVPATPPAATGNFFVDMLEVLEMIKPDYQACAT